MHFSSSFIVISLEFSHFCILLTLSFFIFIHYFWIFFFLHFHINHSCIFDFSSSVFRIFRFQFQLRMKKWLKMKIYLLIMKTSSEKRKCYFKLIERVLISAPRITSCNNSRHGTFYPLDLDYQYNNRNNPFHHPRFSFF